MWELSKFISIKDAHIAQSSIISITDFHKTNIFERFKHLFKCYSAFCLCSSWFICGPNICNILSDVNLIILHCLQSQHNNFIVLSLMVLFHLNFVYRMTKSVIDAKITAMLISWFNSFGFNCDVLDGTFLLDYNCYHKIESEIIFREL